MTLVPTFEGYVRDTQDALILIQAVIDGRLQPAQHRPSEQERPTSIRSGAVYIFNERESSIHRWTDGVSWSPSRILGNFLLYRQLRKRSGDSRGGPQRRHKNLSESFQRQGGGHAPYPQRKDYGEGSFCSTDSSFGPIEESEAKLPNVEWSVYGSLTDSNKFASDSLFKKAISIEFKDSHIKLISYYRADDVKNGLLAIPSQCPQLNKIRIIDEIADKKHFRMPVVLGRSGSVSKFEQAQWSPTQPSYPTPVSNLAMPEYSPHAYRYPSHHSAMAYPYPPPISAVHTTPSQPIPTANSHSVPRVAAGQPLSPPSHPALLTPTSQTILDPTNSVASQGRISVAMLGQEYEPYDGALLSRMYNATEATDPPSGSSYRSDDIPTHIQETEAPSEYDGLAGISAAYNYSLEHY